MTDIGKIIRDGAARLAALDFTAENDRICELRVDIAATDAALDRGNVRIHEINDLLSGRSTVEAATVADALMADGCTTLLAPNPELLTAERDSIAEGMRELRHRREDAIREVDAIKRQARHAAGDELAEIVPALLAKAKAAAAEIVEIYATVEALKDAFDLPIGDLSAAIDFAADGVAGNRRLLPYGVIDTPRGLLDAFETMPSFGPAFEVRLRTQISPPAIPALIRQ